MVYNEDREMVNSVEVAQNVAVECVRASVVALTNEQ